MSTLYCNHHIIVNFVLWVIACCSCLDIYCVDRDKERNPGGFRIWKGYIFHVSRGGCHIQLEMYPGYELNMSFTFAVVVAD